MSTVDRFRKAHPGVLEQQEAFDRWYEGKERTTNEVDAEAGWDAGCAHTRAEVTAEIERRVKGLYSETDTNGRVMREGHSLVTRALAIVREVAEGGGDAV